LIAFGGHGSDVATVTTQDDTTGSRSGESGLCTGANHQGLMLSDCSQYVNREPVCLGEVNDNELDTGLHHRRDEMHVACETIQLCNYERGTVNAADAEGLSECGPFILLTAFDLCELRDPLPVFAVHVRSYGFLLRFEAETARTLLYR
jgi:hypothetical protein